MPRRKHLPHPTYPYHVTARSHGGHWFYNDMDVVWHVMSDYLYFISIAYNVKIHAFVLMSNHFHLIVSTPEANLSRAMNYFMRETSKEINRITGKINQVYGDKYHRSLIDNQFYFSHVYKYVYRNPVTAGVSDACENYKYSTLYGLLGKGHIYIPMTEDNVLFENNKISNVLGWLNQTPAEENYEILKKALRRKKLQFPRNRWRILDKKHSLEKSLF